MQDQSISLFPPTRSRGASRSRRAFQTHPGEECHIRAVLPLQRHLALAGHAICCLQLQARSSRAHILGPVRTLRVRGLSHSKSTPHAWHHHHRSSMPLRAPAMDLDLAVQVSVPGEEDFAFVTTETHAAFLVLAHLPGTHRTHASTIHPSSTRIILLAPNRWRCVRACRLRQG